MPHVVRPLTHASKAIGGCWNSDRHSCHEVPHPCRSSSTPDPHQLQCEVPYNLLTCYALPHIPILGWNKNPALLKRANTMTNVASLASITPRWTERHRFTSRPLMRLARRRSELINNNRPCSEILYIVILHHVR